MSYLSLAAVVAEANRAANDAERLLDLSLLNVQPGEEDKEVKQDNEATPAEDTSGAAATGLSSLIQQFGIFGKKMSGG